MGEYKHVLVTKRVPKTSKDYRNPKTRNPRTLYRYNFVHVDNTLYLDEDILIDCNNGSVDALDFVASKLREHGHSDGYFIVQPVGRHYQKSVARIEL